MEQIHMALDFHSDIDLMNSVTYNPSSLIDRSDTCFPEEYVVAIASRSCAVSRGIGMAERVQEGKDRGAKGIFQGMFRPRVLDLRSQRSRMKTHLITLRDVLANTSAIESASSSSSASLVPAHSPLINSPSLSVCELAISVVPYLRLFMAASDHAKMMLQHGSSNQFAHTIPNNISSAIRNLSSGTNSIIHTRVASNVTDIDISSLVLATDDITEEF
jgi:hypothetical protein